MAFKMIAKSPLTKKLVSALKHKPWAAAHKERAAHPNTAEAHGAPVKLKKKKKEFVPAYPGADISKEEYDKARKAGVKSEAEYAEYKAKMKKKKKSPAKLRKPEPRPPKKPTYPGKPKPFVKSPAKLKKPKHGTGKRIGPGTEQKKNNPNTGTGFMQPPYKDTVKGARPYAKRQGYHGYKNFKSILKK